MGEQFLAGLNSSSAMSLAFAALGLVVGSFLNVVIHRFPLMLERQWARDCTEFLDDAAATPAKLPDGSAPQPFDSAEPLNLMRPRSHCPHCQHPIAWYQNIPVLSYVALRGHCSACKGRISPRYPLIEATCAALFYFCAWRWGWSATALAWSGFSAALLALALIDWDTTLLPDDITLPLMWAGLILAALQLNPGVSLNDAVWGAALGYVSLWSVYWAFKKLTGKEGMGYGDFKLLAALGAWFGWTALLPIVLMASLLGAVVGLFLKWRGSLREGGYVPFGPFLAAAGFTSLFWGPQVILRSVGLAS
jgi:leader peptidase (prepilin peptidase)/N-methyltransferase